MRWLKDYHAAGSSGRSLPESKSVACPAGSSMAKSLLAEVLAGHKYHVTGALPLGHDVCHVANVNPTAQPVKSCHAQSQPTSSLVD